MFRQHKLLDVCIRCIEAHISYSVLDSKGHAKGVIVSGGASSAVMSLLVSARQAAPTAFGIRPTQVFSTMYVVYGAKFYM